MTDRSCPRGFTLVEVLVASLVLAIALIALSSQFVTGVKYTAVAKEDTVMTAFAQDKLEQLKQLPKSTIDAAFGACQGPCLSGCGPCAPLPAGCSAVNCCEDVCYVKGCPAASRLYSAVEDGIPDPNPADDVRESLYVRYWQVERVSLGPPVGCVYRIVVMVGSRNALMGNRPATSGVDWMHATWQEVVGLPPYSNPRRVVLSTYRGR